MLARGSRNPLNELTSHEKRCQNLFLKGYSYFGASLGIKKGNRFLRIMFLGTAAITGVILLYPWIRQTVF